MRPTAEPPRANTAPQRRLAVWLALLAVGPPLLLLLRLFPALDQAMLHSPPAHLLIALTASLIGVTLALLVLHVAHRAGDGRVFLVGMGLLSTASIFITHAISTPNVLMSGRGLVTSLSAPLSLLVGGSFFALSGLNRLPALNRVLMRRARLVLLAYAIGYLAYTWLVLAMLPVAPAPSEPTAASAAGQTQSADAAGHAAHDAYQPDRASPPSARANVASVAQQIQLVVGMGCFAFALRRHYALYRRSPSPAGLGLIYGIAFFSEALLTQYFSQVYTWSFWLYHIQEFIGFGAIGAAVLGAYRRGLTDERLLESLFLAGTREHMRARYVSTMDALVESLARGEQPTPALRDTLRRRFGLAESQIQALEGAALAVAEERRQRQELERLNAALRQLTQMIIHDLKNPLTALVGFIEILRRDRLTDHQRSLVESALRSGSNLSGLIGDLLDISRLEEGRLELDLGLLAPRELLDDCAAEMRGWIIQERKTLSIDAPASLPLLHVDARLIRRVLLNLLSNAIKHTPPGTHITMRARACGAPLPAGGRQLVVEVEDDGAGIPPELLSQVFEKFGRFTGKQSTRQDSTGLGLTLCRLVVEAHGGAIGVSSLVGQGTVFRVVLPAS